MGPSIYDKGAWSCAYAVSPVERPLSAAEFRQLLIEITERLTGWPVWLELGNRPEMAPRVADGGVIECRLDRTSEMDFWRADPRGRMYLIRRLQEDTREIRGVRPGQVLDLTLPVWRTGECLLHAERLAGRLGVRHLDLQMRWQGLKGRELSTFASPMRSLMPGRISHQDVVETRVRTEADAISDTLPELVRQLTQPLFEVFDFAQPGNEMYATELERLRKGI